MLRKRRTKAQKLETVKKFDAFPKIQENYTEFTTFGGGLSIITKILIVIFIINELQYYYEQKIKFSFKPDNDLSTKLKMNIDITLAMPCKSIGADILDSTGQNIFSFGTLQQDDTWWDLCPNQKLYFEYMQQLNSYLTEEYHSVAKLLHKRNSGVSIYSFPERTYLPDIAPDACRVHGSLSLNKVSGNLHITSGRSLQFPQGHLHLNIIFSDPLKSNFSHRIYKFSFGSYTTGIVHPLVSIIY